ncbi:M16 family metallopeptidase [Bdellovibrio svalbardensis]|uniref:Insulinase family protein n=1 Tax=Bdellovibrio svalbardensis TaxID=2972972 RepID=A0ABT6DM15_9BACT|nr:pitrilysin family protein [Bdellovibrio svalbardensis]MDG0817916.1 insulinase family protein [Bdellovibrio svalbardensis]
MRKFNTTLSTLLVVPFAISAFTGCSTSKPKSEKAADGYVSKTNGSFTLQPFKEVNLENGLKIIFIRDVTLPRVSMTLLVKTGSVQEPASQAGLNALTAYLLEQGTQSRDANTIADEFGQMGSNLDISPGADVTTIYSDSLTSTADDLLSLISDVAINPAFKDGELVRMRSQVLAGLKKKIDNPSSFTDEKMDEFLFGDHPYGRDVNGTVEGVKSITKQDIIKQYLTFYRPNNSTLAVVGQFGDDFEKKVSDVFGKWTKRSIPVVNVPAAPSIEKLQVRLYVKKGLQQTQIRMSALGIQRVDPDFLALRLGNEILGGGFASRLNQKVRDDLGLTYSIYSNFDIRKDRGSFDISTFSKNESAGKAFDESLKVVSDYLANGADEKEVSAGRNQLVGQFPRAIETADRLAYNLLVLDFYGIPFDYLTTYNKNVSELTVKKVNDAFKRHVDAQKFKAVIYGNESIIPQFQKYNPEVIKVP